MVFELQLGAIRLPPAVPVAVEKEDKLVEERPHPEATGSSVGMEAPPKVSKTVRRKEASTATIGVVNVVVIITTVDLRGARWVNVKVGV